MPQGTRTGIGPMREEARLFGPALCQLLSNPVEEPTQASTSRHVRSGPRQLAVHLPASCSAHDSHRFAYSQSMSLYRFSTCFVWCFRPARTYAPGQAYWNQDGIISDRDSQCCRLPRVHGPRANLRQEPCRSSRDITGLREPVQAGLF